MIKKIIFFILILSSVALANLSNYPEPFVENGRYNNLIMVIGTGDVEANSFAAAEIALGMPTNVGTSKTMLDTEVTSLNGNMIVVGGPCDNKITKLILGTDDCNAGLKKGQGLLKYFELNNSNVLIVTGYGGDEIKNVAKIIRYHINYNFSSVMSPN